MPVSRRSRSAWLCASLLGLSTFGLSLRAPGLLSAQTSPTYIHTVAGGGSTVGVDGGDALAAQLNRAEGLAMAGDGAVYLADSHHHRVWKVTNEGTMLAVAGTGVPGFSGDGGPARQARLNVPEGLAVGPDGSLYIGDTVNRRVRKVSPDGTVATVAGTGERGYSGDGGPATSAGLTDPNDLAVGPDGTLYILDEQGGEIRRVTSDGAIDTVPLEISPSEVESPVINPFGLTVDGEGSLHVSDGTGHQVWRLAEGDGAWALFAGTGTAGFGGDGGPATQAQLHRPEGLAAAPDGSVYIADRNNHRVRRVSSDGRITTVAASGEAGFSGDTGDALAAQLDQPLRVAVGSAGEVFVNDLGNDRVRLVTSSATWPTTTTTTTTTTTSLPPSSTTTSTTTTSTTTPPTTRPSPPSKPTTTSVPRSTTTTTSTTFPPPSSTPRPPSKPTTPSSSTTTSTTRPPDAGPTTTTRPGSGTRPPGPATTSTTVRRGPETTRPTGPPTTTRFRPRRPKATGLKSPVMASGPAKPSRPSTGSPSPGTTTPGRAGSVTPSTSETSGPGPSVTRSPETASSPARPPTTSPRPKDGSRTQSSDNEPPEDETAIAGDDSDGPPSPPQLASLALAALAGIVVLAAGPTIWLVVRYWNV